MNKQLKNIFWIFSLFFFAIFNISVHASDPVIIKDSIDSYPLGLHFEYFEDKTTTLSFNEILSPHINNQFRKHEKKDANFGKSQSAFWLRFNMINKMSTEQELLLESTWPLYDKLTIYIQNSSGKYEEKKYGNIYPFKNRDIKSNNFIIKLNPQINLQQTIYIRIETETSVQAPFTIWHKYKFFEHDKNHTSFISIILGIYLIMMLYNFLIFLSIKDKAYFYYVIYLFLNLLFQISFLGIGYNLLWPEYPHWNLHSMPLFFGTGLISILFFSKTFLKLDIYSPNLNLIFNYFIIINCVITSASFFEIFYTLKLINLTSTISVLLIIISSIITIKKGYKPARYFLAGWIFFLSGSIILILKVNGILPSNFFTTNSMLIGSSFEISLLSLALADKINTIKQDLINNQIFALDVQTRMTNSFARFVPKEFLTFLNKESIIDIELGNQIQKNMVVLFSDIRSFTELSEKMTPQENFNFLNSYLSRIGPIVRINNGFIDKYIGDAIMALFPESAENAIDTAIDIQREIVEYNALRKLNNYPEIQIGIGIHSGNLMLGTIGEENRMEGTVISDDVNLASRIESLTKYYGVSILISGRLFKKLYDKNKYNYRVIDTVIVKGKNKPVTLIEILDEKTTQYYDLKINTKTQFIKAIKLYRERSINEAFKIFNDISLEMKGIDNVIEIYKTRCKLLLQNGISEDWNGIERLDSK